MDITGIVGRLGGIRGVHAIILFGSQARGESKPISDVDICVLADRGLPYSAKADIACHGAPKRWMSPCSGTCPWL